MYQQAFDAGVRGLHIGEKTYLEVPMLFAAFSTAYGLPWACRCLSFDRLLHSKLVASVSASNDINVSNPEVPDVCQASGGEWNKDLLFNVPRQHEEVQRLEGRYKK